MKGRGWKGEGEGTYDPEVLAYVKAVKNKEERKKAPSPNTVT